MFGQDEHERDAKNRTSTNEAFEHTNPLEMVKNQFRLLNRSILMSEQETDAKNRTSTNLACRLTNPLEMVKKTFQAVESLNFEVRARS